MDSFEIQEVTLYKGEWKDSLYTVSADVLDGVSSVFVSRFVDQDPLLALSQRVGRAHTTLKRILLLIPLPF